VLGWRLAGSEFSLALADYEHGTHVHGSVLLVFCPQSAKGGDYNAFLGGVAKFVSTVDEARRCLRERVELKRPDEALALVKVSVPILPYPQSCSGLVWY
jgi:hypothetical protein